MSIPTIQGIAGILTDPTVEATPQGTPILKLFIAMNDSRYDEQERKWVTMKQFAVEAVAWEKTAERLGNVLSKGDQIYVEGRLETQSWEDKNGGGKRSKPVLTIRTARKLEKTQSQNNGGGFGGNNSGGSANSWNAPAEDPWSSNTGGGWGNPSDQPAF